MDPLSNTRKRSSKVCLRPWDTSIWGDHKHIAKVKHCDKVRQYLELNHNNVFFEDSPAYSNQHYNDMNVEKLVGTNDNKIDDSVNTLDDLTKVRIKFDLPKYYKDEIFKRTQNIGQLEKMIVEYKDKLLLARAEKDKYVWLLERLLNPNTVLQLQTPKSASKLIRENNLTPHQSPPSLLKNNCKANSLKLVGNKSRGEGVSEVINKKND